MDIWKVRGRFPTSEEMSRMVAAEVRARVESNRFADGFAIPNLNVGRASKGFLELVLFYV